MKAKLDNSKELGPLTKLPISASMSSSQRDGQFNQISRKSNGGATAVQMLTTALTSSLTRKNSSSNQLKLEQVFGHSSFQVGPAPVPSSLFASLLWPRSVKATPKD